MSFVTAKEVAAHLSVSLETVYRLAQEGSIPHLRAGRAYRFDLDKVTTALETAKPDPWQQSARSLARRRGPRPR